MGSVHLTLCTGILVSAAALTPVAHAADGGPRDGGVSVAPAAPAPGTDVSLRVRGCTAAQGTAVSTAFVSDARLTGGQGTLAGQTRVRTSLRPGAYDVKITCAAYAFTSRITVAERPGGGSSQAGRPDGQSAGRQDGQDTRPDGQDTRPGDSSDDPDSGDGPGTPASPVAPVHAGGGGTAAGDPAATDTLFATVAPSGAGPGAVQAVTGLLLAGAAAAAVGALRARRRRDSD